MKTLIAYYSFSGNNAILAALLKSRLGADVYEITEPRPRKAYACVTLCGGRDGQQAKIERQLTRAAGKPPLFVRQLALRDWLPEDRKSGARKGTSFKISENDLVYFRPAIDELVGDLFPKKVKTLL